MNTRIPVTAIVAACCIALVACSKNASDGAGAPVPGGPARYRGPLPPLPAPEYPLPRPQEVVKAVYDFAGRRPDVLHYMPCFCGCQASGHVGNDDCFVASRDSSGKPTWDLHGMG